MPLDAWLPVGMALPDGARLRNVIDEGADWQIFNVEGGGRALVASEALARRWAESGLVADDMLPAFQFGAERFFEVSSGDFHALHRVPGSKSPDSGREIQAFADALRESRAIDAGSSFHGAIYVEKLSRLLPTSDVAAPMPDGEVFGTWLTGGIPVSVDAFRRLRSIVSWMSEQQLRAAIARAGLAPAGTTGAVDGGASSNRFSLAGRPALEAFLTEHVIDIIENAERYKALGIDFPSAIILHGPPGCGKTFAIERLVEHLGWPSFHIEAASVASPFVHETSRKVAAMFEEAMKASPSVLVIDEMEAFLADREMGTGHHRVEEVAEFLRRIPEAVNNRVLIIAMTNRIEMIDPAILRRGRFDHVIAVGMATEVEVQALLDKLVGDLPHAGDIDSALLARRLVGRPLSDVAFVVREAARMVARAGGNQLDQQTLLRALDATAPRGDEADNHRKIGFT